MRRAAFAIISTVVGLVLLLSFKTHPLPSANRQAAAALAPRGGAGTGSTSGRAGSGPAGSSGSSRSVGSAHSGAAATSAARKVTGAAVETPYGPVQVQLTLHGTRITRARAVQVPSGTSLDAQINGYAIPALDQEAVQAQSANIDMVSGATYTSQGYLDSLQSAIDKIRRR